ncbi:host cell division inhibitor Icd-like protein [Citrobacter freundii]|uniref:host cell division inhibitor Icd-like protein n=1 Tax=Citrobacter freundii TaxID=546 RepID=UPI001C3A3718|nr:host cell division inhibitor Icd-like protein [Citrobacter freundii]MDE9645336.1 host cell division inhibitor Icd-like protein [Citrobacter freundii]MDE9695857.1 host cell division inhibitor Icd-like protein [Citrobacter freundii]MDE9699639.1 host cell division inhibitor Icd-like protein [Citrobacter freundii]MEB0809206.1 host cell division inhibitor Icd-like protein [Citrobacter freundii]HBH6853132.1 host cell division inhibitor Icd-like protein [Citrobacter freundii]
MAITKFTYVFAAINRHLPKPRPVMIRTVAVDEKSARERYASDYTLVFSCRLPTGGVQ